VKKSLSESESNKGKNVDIFDASKEEGDKEPLDTDEK
jgi:hypothetical protein